MITVAAPAKINLTLSVEGVREDGYHLLSSVFQSVTLCDTVTLREAPSLSLSLSDPSLPSDGRNTAYRAAEVFLRSLGRRGGASIRVEKRIPQRAGLGGGSADAAAVLVGLNALYGTRYSPERLREMGLQVGADVPFCLTGGTALVRGIGERITPLPPLPRCAIVIATPRFGVSTKEAYDAVDRARPAPLSQEGMCRALAEGDLRGVGERLFNAFERALDLPPIGELKRRMSAFFPLGCGMSGSGSAVFALFADEAAAMPCYESLSDVPHYLCAPSPRGAVRV